MRAMFTLPIHPGAVEEYREAHRAVWPSMRSALSSAGFRNYSIFLGDSTAIGYYEADDPTEVWRRLASYPAAVEWQRANIARVRNPPGAEGPLQLTEVFHLD